MRAVLVSAAGEYADPWHPFAETSAELARVLEPLVGAVEMRTDVDDALTGLRDPVDLLVLNLGDAGPGRPSPAAEQGLLAHAAAGRPILAVHSTATTFPDWPRWAELLGGRWIRDTTFHPPYGEAHIVCEPAHPASAGLASFDTVDECYTAMQVAPESEVLAWHELDGRRHPLAWVRPAGPARAAFVALGHDAAAYGEGPRALIGRVATWLLQRPVQA